jgi:putative ABC transport system permease protein
MGALRQYLSLLQLSLLMLPQRAGASLTLVFGVICAVAGLISMLAIGEGARNQESSDWRPDRILLMSSGSPDDMQSRISTEVAPQLYELPGIRRTPNGQPIAISEVFIEAQARARHGGALMPFRLTGATNGLEDLMPELRLTAGRLFHPGLNELIASDACNRLLSGFQVGYTRLIGGTKWRVVGNFRLGQSDMRCLAYADATSVMSTFSRHDYNVVAVMLTSAAEYPVLAGSLAKSPALRVDAKPETEVGRAQYAHFNAILTFASYFVGAIMAFGATLGAANSLYAIVDGRRRELATLLAFGFGSGPIILSTLTESTLLAIPGALIGAGLAKVLFDGTSASPFGFALRLSVTPGLSALGMALAILIGLIAGLFPAIRAARVPVTTALRAI